MKIRPVGAEFFHADGQTSMKLVVAFLNFANAPKNWNLTILYALKYNFFIYFSAALEVFFL
jgi:hypothetical protein